MLFKSPCSVSTLLTSSRSWYRVICANSKRWTSSSPTLQCHLASLAISNLRAHNSKLTQRTLQPTRIHSTQSYTLSASPLAPRDRSGFKIVVICALPLEANFVRALFDKHWDEEGNTYGKAYGDRNAYSVGVIGKHNVVLAHMPGIGKANAAAVAADIRSSFPNIELALLVGVCGGVPFYRSQHKHKEVILGDVVISQALIQYDYGRRYYRDFRTKRNVEDDFGRPFPVVRAFLAKLQTDQIHQKMLSEMNKHLAILGDMISYPGAQADKLFESSYIHKHHLASEQVACHTCAEGSAAVCDVALAADCDELKCDHNKLVKRERLLMETETIQRPPLAIHFGRVASGDAVIRSGVDRDKIALEHKVMAFEMEGAGVWETFPSIVIKGVCDYADSHKNKVWQRYAAATAASCTKAVLHEWSSGAHAEPVWHVPFEYMPGFVGRGYEIEQTSRTLFSTKLHRRSAIFGLGGTGKSRLSLEIAHRAKQDTPGLSVFWIQATDLSSFEQDCYELGCRLQVPGIEDEGADVKELLQQHLTNTTNTKWLLILDGADDESLWASRSNSCWSNRNTGLGVYLPKSPYGSTLVTTRSRRIAMHMAGRNMIELSEMSIDEAVETLNNLLIDPGSRNDDRSATKLVQQLSCLPLAVVQAAAYMNLNGLSIPEYLDLLSARGEEDIISLLSEGFEDEIRYTTSQNAVATTWLISFEQLHHQHRVAADLLSYMACLHENDIPQSLLPNFSSRKEFVDAIGVLRGYSFVKRHILESSTEQFFEMHRLVRLATRNWLRSQNLLSKWVESAMKQTTAVLERVLFEAKEKRALYMSHTIVLNSSKGLENSFCRHMLMLRMAQHFEANGDFNESVRLAKSAATWMDLNSYSAGGEKQEAYRVWGLALASRGELTESVQLLEQVRSYHTMQSGPPTIEALKCMNNLGFVYSKLGKLHEAEKILLNCIESSKGRFGPSDDITLSSTSHLAWVYQMTGRLDEAEALAKEVLELSALTPESSDSASRSARFTLASIYTDEGKYSEAECLLKDVIDTRSTVYGPEHPKVMEGKHQLAAVYQRMGRLPLAESMQQEVVSTLERLVGSKALTTQCSRESLAQIYKTQGRFHKAKTIEKLASKVYETTLGPLHRHTLNCKRSLAHTYWKLGHSPRAIGLTREVMAVQRRQFGSYDMDTLVTMASLASMLAGSEDLQASLGIYGECVRNATIALGDDHPFTIKCKRAHATLLVDSGFKLRTSWFSRFMLSLRRYYWRRKMLRR